MNRDRSVSTEHCPGNIQVRVRVPNPREEAPDVTWLACSDISHRAPLLTLQQGRRGRRDHMEVVQNARADDPHCGRRIRPQWWARKCHRLSRGDGDYGACGLSCWPRIDSTSEGAPSRGSFLGAMHPCEPTHEDMQYSEYRRPSSATPEDKESNESRSRIIGPANTR